MSRLIDSEALIDQIKTLEWRTTGSRSVKIFLAELKRNYEESVIQIIESQPTVDAVPVKRGKWILHDNGDATCNQCGRHQKAIWDYDNWQNYCGNCGAEMIGVENERD